MIRSFQTSATFLMETLLHALHLTGTMLEYLAHFSLELLVSARDMLLFKSEFNDGGMGRAGEVSC